MPHIKIDHWHPYAERFPLLAGDEWESFVASIRRSRGNREPVIYRRLPDGTIQGIDGRNRYRACQEVGVKARCEEEILETDAEVIDFIRDKNLNRRHLTREDRQKFAEEFAAEGQSNRQIAQALGVSHQTVGRYLKEASGPNGPDDATPTKPREPEKIVVFEPIQVPQRTGELIPGLKLKALSPRIVPDVARLSEAQQHAFLARLNEGQHAGAALAEVQQMGPGPEPERSTGVSKTPATCPQCGSTLKGRPA